MKLLKGQLAGSSQSSSFLEIRPAKMERGGIGLEDPVAAAVLDPEQSGCALSRMYSLLQWVMQSVHSSAGLLSSKDSQEVLVSSLDFMSTYVVKKASSTRLL